MVGVIVAVSESCRFAEIAAPFVPEAVHLDRHEFETDAPFTQSLVGQEVSFDVESDGRGLRARNCWLASVALMEVAADNLKAVEV